MCMRGATVAGGVDRFLANQLHQYAHRETVKKEVLSVVKNFKDLSPTRADFYKSDGSCHNLIKLFGTIPVPYHGKDYNIPIAIWLEQNHPYQPPIVIVEPTPSMVVKPGKHVDPSGMVFLPYLHEWRNSTSDISTMIQVLTITFSEEPPVFARPANQPFVGSVIQGHRAPGYPVQPPQPRYPHNPVAGPGYPVARAMPMPTPGQPQSHAPYPGAVPTGYPSATPAVGRMPYPGGPAHQPYPAGPHPPYPSAGSHPPYPSTASGPSSSMPPYPGGPPPGYPGTTSTPTPYPTGGPQPPYPSSCGSYQPPTLPGSTVSTAAPSTNASLYSTYPGTHHASVTGSVSTAGIMATTAAVAGTAGLVHEQQQRSAVDEDAVVKQSLVAAVEDKIKRRIRGTFDQATVEMSELQQTQQRLRQGSEQLHRMMDKMQRLQIEAESNISVLMQKGEDLHTVLEKLEQESEAVDVDEAVVTTAPLYNQMLQLISEDNSIDDAIYYLGEALRKDVITLESFLKYVRELSRRQFLVRALIMKAQQHACM